MRRAGGMPRGFTLLELVICLVALTVLVAVLLERLARYQEMAEQAAMESTARVVKTGLQLRLAQLIIANRQADAHVLEIADPVVWLDPKPANYVGIYREPLRPGSWYFDEERLQLVYVVNSGSRLDLDGQTARSGVKEVRYRVRLLKDRVRIAGGSVESVTGITLLPVVPYRWR